MPVFCFRIFAILAGFWEVLGLPKINKKSKKSCSGRFWNAFKIFDLLGDGLGKVLVRFGEGFERGSKAFWRLFRSWRNLREAFRVAGLALMIRATRGRSRRPNHMRSHLDA